MWHATWTTKAKPNIFQGLKKSKTEIHNKVKKDRENKTERKQKEIEIDRERKRDRERERERKKNRQRDKIFKKQTRNHIRPCQ